MGELPTSTDCHTLLRTQNTVPQPQRKGTAENIWLVSSLNVSEALVFTNRPIFDVQLVQQLHCTFCDVSRESCGKMSLQSSIQAPRAAQEASQGCALFTQLLSLRSISNWEFKNLREGNKFHDRQSHILSVHSTVPTSLLYHRFV